MSENSSRGRARIVSPTAQAILALSSIALGVVLGVLDGTIAGTTLIVLGVFGLAMAVVRLRQGQAPAPVGVPSHVEPPPVGRFYIAIAGLMCIAGAGYMVFQGIQYASERSLMSIVGFLGSLIAATLGVYIFGGLFVSRRKASGGLGPLASRLYPRLAEETKPADERKDDE
jgi:hypothetical protein